MSRFTIPLGLGNDICHIPRIYKILTSARGPRFVERILTDRERQGPRPARILQCVSGGLPPVKATRDPAFWKAAEFVAGRCVADCPLPPILPPAGASRVASRHATRLPTITTSQPDQPTD